MLLTYGDVKVPQDWHVYEKNPPGYSRVYHVLKGSVTYTDRFGPLKLKHDMIYIFPSGIGYEMSQDPNDTLRCTFMHLDFSPAVIDEIVETGDDDSGFARSLFVAIKSAISDKSEMRVKILASAFEVFCNERGITNHYDERISESISYICENFSKSITVSEIAKTAGYNEQYFIRLFRENTGSTPHKYLMSRRLKEAGRLLSENISVTRIAEMTGFGDVNSFSRAFRNEFGVTPTDHRRKDVTP